MQLGPESLSRLLSCRDYRAFILAYKEERSQQNKLSYTMIARRAGFSSRSFPRDVATGTKNITLKSLEAMIKGLGLQGDLAEYFRNLVHLDHPETCHPPKKPTELRRKLHNLRSRVRNKKRATGKDPYYSELIPIIYAACGEEDQGATTEEIIRKTGLPRAKVEATLADILEMKILKCERQRYYPTESHFFFEGLKQSQAFQKFFHYLLECAADNAKADFASDRKLFFTSCFSVKNNSLPLLKNELKQVLINYVDAAEDPGGDKVCSLVCALI